MEYSPGQIIIYKENSGYKRTLYGIVVEQFNSNHVRVFTELKDEPMLDLFFDPKTTNSSVTIEKIVNSYKEIPETKNGNQFSSERYHLRELAKFMEKNYIKK